MNGYNSKKDELSHLISVLRETKKHKNKKTIIKKRRNSKNRKYLKTKGNESISIYCKKTNKCVDYLIHLLLCNKQLLKPQ